MPIVPARKRWFGNIAPKVRPSLNTGHWQARGLILWVPIVDDISNGARVYDFSTRGYHGTVVNSSAASSVVIGPKGHRSAFFSITGNNGVVWAQSELVSLVNTFNFTVYAYALNTNLAVQTLFSWATANAASSRYELFVAETDGPRIFQQYGLGTINPVLGDMTGVPHLYVNRVSGNNSALFVDGVNVATASGTAAAQSPQEFEWGARTNDGTELDGITWELRVYNYAQSDAQIVEASQDLNALWAPRRTFVAVPAALGAHDLLADDIVLPAPLLSTTALGQVHALTADALVGAAPALNSPAIGQTHQLLAGDIVLPSPELDAATLGQEHALLADDITTPAPVLSKPRLDFEGASPTAGRSSLLQRLSLNRLNWRG